MAVIRKYEIGTVEFRIRVHREKILYFLDQDCQWLQHAMSSLKRRIGSREQEVQPVPVSYSLDSLTAAHNCVKSHRALHKTLRDAYEADLVLEIKEFDRVCQDVVQY